LYCQYKTHARIPIIKLYARRQHGGGIGARWNNFIADISVGNLLAIYNTRLIKAYTQVDDRYRYLVLFCELSVPPSSDEIVIFEYSDIRLLEPDSATSETVDRTKEDQRSISWNAQLVWVGSHGSSFHDVCCGTAYSTVGFLSGPFFRARSQSYAFMPSFPSQQSTRYRKAT
jgi:hypothetical protein